MSLIGKAHLDERCAFTRFSRPLLVSHISPLTAQKFVETLEIQHNFDIFRLDL